MFKKNDPLINSVKTVMMENEIRRNVEKTFNENLGIHSKKALPHEYHAQYDAALKECVDAALAEQKGMLPFGPDAPGSSNKIAEGKAGTVPTTDKEKKLAALAEPKHLVTHKDVLNSRGVIPEDKISSGGKSITTGSGNKPLEVKEEEELDEVSKKKLKSYLSDTDYASHDPGSMDSDNQALQKKYAAGRKLAKQKLSGKAKVHAKEETEHLEEKALSKAQHRFFGLVRGIQKGKAHGSAKAEKAAKEMSVKSVRDYAKTKEKGLPEKKGKE